MKAVEWQAWVYLENLRNILLDDVLDIVSLQACV